MARPSHDGACYKVGPLFAADAEVARALVARLLHELPTPAPLLLYVPDGNPAAVALAEELGMARTWETLRMYTGETPAVATEGIFGLTTLELG